MPTDATRPPAGDRAGDTGIGAHIVLTFDQRSRPKRSSGMPEHAALDQAFDHYRAGQVDTAVQLCRNVIARDPNDADANHMLAIFHFTRGNYPAAREFMVKATSSAEATAEMHNNFGSVLFALDDMPRATDAFKRALALKPDYAEAHNNLGVVRHANKRIEAAIESFSKAAHLKPDLTAARSNLRAARRKLVPTWHFAMMGDHARNAAYEAAIRRAVPGKHVLDIGTGAGLLAMMAARAGAAHVTTCEAVGTIAEQAREIVARNGLASRVTVIGKRSQDLVIGQDIPQRADVLVTETFSSGLIDEGVIPTIEHAHAHLLAPAATVIPAAASVMGYLAGGQMLSDMLSVGHVSGFDLSSFNELAPTKLGMLLDLFPHDILSGDMELMRFDFRDKKFPMAGRRAEVRVTSPGTCVGVAQWIRLELDSTARYDNRPSPNAAVNGHWNHVTHRFAEPLVVTPGQVIPLVVRNHRSEVTVSLGSSARPL